MSLAEVSGNPHAVVEYAASTLNKVNQCNKLAD
jgi:hypothetical protein